MGWGELRSVAMVLMMVCGFMSLWVYKLVSLQVGEIISLVSL